MCKRDTRDERQRIFEPILHVVRHKSGDRANEVNNAFCFGSMGFNDVWNEDVTIAFNSFLVQLYLHPLHLLRVVSWQAVLHAHAEVGDDTGSEVIHVGGERIDCIVEAARGDAVRDEIWPVVVIVGPMVLVGEEVGLDVNSDAG